MRSSSQLVRLLFDGGGEGGRLTAPMLVLVLLVLALLVLLMVLAVLALLALLLPLPPSPPLSPSTFGVVVVAAEGGDGDQAVCGCTGKSECSMLKYPRLHSYLRLSFLNCCFLLLSLILFWI